MHLAMVPGTVPMLFSIPVPGPRLATSIDESIGSNQLCFYRVG